MRSNEQKVDVLGIKLFCLLARKSGSTKTWRLSVLWSAHEAKNKVKDLDFDTNMKMANNKILISQQDIKTDSGIQTHRFTTILPKRKIILFCL